VSTNTIFKHYLAEGDFNFKLNQRKTVLTEKYTNFLGSKFDIRNYNQWW